MDWSQFIVVGENLHCTRIVKRGGIKTTELPGGGEAVAFQRAGEDRVLPIPSNWEQVSPAFGEGKVKHIALAIYQSLHGTSDEQAAGADYLCYLAERQIENGATFLDLNVDEYSTAPSVQGEMMVYMVEFLSKRYDTPLSIDSSNPETLATGLAGCRSDIAPPMINSISLERPSVIDLAKQFNADAIVNAAGREGMPADADERTANFSELIALLDAAGIERSKLHLDPLVLPISTDPMNGMHFINATSQARRKFEGVHLSGGLSNISFGMPSRKLLNMTFAYLCVEAGTDGGIIDPAVMPVAAIAALDTESEPFQMAKAVLVGEDMFGMEFITAYRDGKFK